MRRSAFRITEEPSEAPNRNDGFEMAKLVARVRANWLLFSTFVVAGSIFGFVLSSRYRVTPFQTNVVLEIDEAQSGRINDPSQVVKGFGQIFENPEFWSTLLSGRLRMRPTFSAT